MIANRLKVTLYPSKKLNQKEVNGNFIYESFDNDPFFQIVNERKNIKAGWYILNYSFKLKKGEVILPKVYFDFGDGFSEKYHWKLFYHGNEIFGLVKIPWDCYKIRLDISEKNVAFEHGLFTISKVNKAFAAFHIFSILDKLGESRSGFFRELINKKSIQEKKDLLKSLSEGSYLTLEYQKVPLQTQRTSESLDDTITLLTYSSINTEKYVTFLHNKEVINKAKEKAITRTVASIDIILPVYNGLEFLLRLIPQIIKNTDLPFNLYIINDCSSDPQVALYLNTIAAQHTNIYVQDNETNLGFTKTVNRLLKKCTNDIIVLLNSDIEVPFAWLSKLIEPMLLEDNIGTITPMSNSATICSFPNMGDNQLLDNNDVERINKPLAEIDLYYEDIPTGVGFCMVINNNMLQKIGYLDEETFPRGYGEENDLCFRGRKNGFRNVINTGLFIYHKHGGSFDSDEKVKLMQENQQKLERKHPDFTPVIRKYFKENTFIFIKLVYLLKLVKNDNKKIVLFLDHDLGGGTNTYSRNYHTSQPSSVFLYGQYINPNRNADKQILFSITYANYNFKFGIDDLDLLFDLLILYGIQLEEIIINNVVSFHNVTKIVDSCIAYKKRHRIELTVLCHDFFYICPNFLLFKNNSEFCNIPSDLNVCSQCLTTLSNSIDPKLIPNDFTSIVDWRNKWEKLLVAESDKIVAFSDSTKALFIKVWPALANKITVEPHQLINFKKHSENFIRVGILGNIHSVAKGAKFVQDLADYLETNNLQEIKLVSIGNIHPHFDHDYIDKIGHYSIEDLHFKLLQNKIDVIFIPSVCSETFSFTTREAIETGIPTACFKLGGQYDQVKNYDKGIVVTQIKPEVFVDAVKSYFKGVLS